MRIRRVQVGGQLAIHVWRNYLAAAVVLAAMIGCGSKDPFAYVQVTGKVTYEDGTPVPGGQLQFTSETPPVGAAYPRPASASIAEDGTFDAVTSRKYGDGLVQGKHKVSFIFATDAKGRPLVREEYLSPASTPLLIDTADAPLHIKVPKP